MKSLQTLIAQSREKKVMVNVPWSQLLEDELRLIATDIDHETIGTRFAHTDGASTLIPDIGWCNWCIRLVKKEGTSYYED